MSAFRRERVGDQLRIELADLIQREIRDPRAGFVTVTEVRMSPDLRHARVYVSILGDDEERATSLRVLERATGFLRSQVGKRIKLRHVPELNFVIDDTLDTSARIESLLDESGTDRSAGDDPSDPQNGGTDGDA